MESSQDPEAVSDSDGDIKAFLDRLKTTADALDAALYDARRLHATKPTAEMPADRAA